MNVTVDILNESSNHWLPDQKDCNNWITGTLTIADYNENCGVSLKFVDAAESKTLNDSFRNKPYPTNVLSFPADLPGEIASRLDYRPLGDIVICPEVLEKEAIDQGKTLVAHWAHLVTHGVLHLLGYEHENQDEADYMESLEIICLEKQGFANPYDLEQS